MNFIVLLWASWSCEPGRANYSCSRLIYQPANNKFIEWYFLVFIGMKILPLSDNHFFPFPSKCFGSESERSHFFFIIKLFKSGNTSLTPGIRILIFKHGSDSDPHPRVVRLERHSVRKQYICTKLYAWICYLVKL